jgi:hypothetical protein
MWLLIEWLDPIAIYMIGKIHVNVNHLHFHAIFLGTYTINVFFFLALVLTQGQCKKCIYVFK